MTRRKLRRARIARNAWARIAHRTLTHLDGEPAEPTSVLRDLYPAEVWGAFYMPTRGPERRRINRRWAARLSVAALLQRHAEWSLDQAGPTTVRDLPRDQRERALEVAREIARVLTLAYGDEGGAAGIEAGVSQRSRALRAGER